MKTLIDEKVAELQQKLYGPRYCEHCKQVQPVMTYKLQGTDYFESEGFKVKAGFTGAHVCQVCRHTIEESRSTEDSSVTESHKVGCDIRGCDGKCWRGSK
jgi:hypothetical protein